MRRFLGLTIKTLAVFVLIGILGVGVALWRIASEPIHSESLTPYIEKTITRLIPGTRAEIASSSVTWDNRKHTLLLTAKNVLFYDGKDVKVASFPSISLKGSLWSYLRGRVLPIQLTSEGAHFWLTRNAEGVFSLGDWTSGRADDANGINVFSFLEAIADELSNGHLRQDLSIKNALISVRDRSVDQDWTVTVPEITINHDLKSSTGLAKVEVSQGERATTMEARYNYDMGHKRHALTWSFQDIRLPALASQHPDLAELAGFDLPLNGEITLEAEHDLSLVEAHIKVDSGAGKVTYPAFWNETHNVNGMSLRLDYAQDKSQINLSKAEIDFGGPHLTVVADAKVPVDKSVAWRFPRSNSAFNATVRLENLPIDKFDAYWPKPAIPDARDWIVANLKKGLFTEGEVRLEGKINWDNLNDSVLSKGNGYISAKEGTVTYLEGMPAVEKVDAEATFDLDKMDVKILGGSSGAIKLLPFTIHMTDFQNNVQYITLPVHLTGPVQDVLKLLDAPPLGYAKAVGLDPADGTGIVDGVLTLHMPMLDALLLKDVEIKAQANLSGVGFKKLVPGIEIAQGALTLDLTKDGFQLNGPLSLNKIPAQLAWKSRFGSDPKSKEPIHKATVTSTVKGEQWNALGLGEGITVKGETPVTIHYANVRKGFSTLDGQVGFRQADVKIDQLGWEKPIGVAADLSFAMDMPVGKNVTVKSIDLQGPGTRVKGKAVLDHELKSLLSADFSPFVIGRSNAEVHFSQSIDPSSPVKISVEGESFDVSKMKGDKDPAQAIPRPKEYNIKLIKFYTSDTGYLSSVKAHARRDSEGWVEIDLWGLAQGSIPLDMKLTPRDGVSTFSVKADDFGIVLKGLGFSDGVTGGNLDISGESAPENPRTIRGKVKIGSFNVADLPLLARLFSAVSPFGFVDLITGNAGFYGLRGHFTWQDDEIVLSKVRASGSVAGINLDGRINMNTGGANLNGTIVPFSFANSILGAIPLLGDVITGGEGEGIIAASFTIKGDLADPHINVNPISLLTPGFLRNLFFSGDDVEEKIDLPEKPLGSDKN